MENGKNAGHKLFIPFATMFAKSFLFQGRQKMGLCGKDENIAKTIISVIHWEENTVGKENTSGCMYQQKSFSIQLK